MPPSKIPLTPCLIAVLLAGYTALLTPGTARGDEPAGDEVQIDVEVRSDEAKSPAEDRALPAVPPPIAGVEKGFVAAGQVALPETAPGAEHGLVNIFRLSDQIVSGSEPTGPESFEYLKSLGIHTILSVDGKAPDADAAASYGLRYVHVPIQYRGITADETLQIAKTFRELDGPFYVHCYHGKHRGPAAAAIGRVVLDGAGRETAIAEMRQWCGTSPSYDGLYLSIATGLIPGQEETLKFAWDFPAALPFDGLRDLMIEMTRVDDQLKYLSKTGWAPSADHPDANPGAEAARLIDLFAKGVALQEAAPETDLESPQIAPDFQAWMLGSLEAGQALKGRIEAFQAGDATADDVTAAYKAISRNCKECHGKYRDG